MKWIQDKTHFNELSNGYVEITTPFLDRHNDYIQLYVKKENNRFVLTDGGYIINDLADSGCSVETGKRKMLLNNTLLGFGIQNRNNHIYASASKENYPVVYNNIIQALISVDDLFYTSSPTVESIFYEDVAAWLSEKNVRHIPKIKFSGKTGFNHEFHFGIPKSDKAPERIVQAINNPQQNKIGNLIWMWEDSKEFRPKKTQLYAILNDSEKNVDKSVQAFEQYDIQAFPWSKRGEYVETLTA